MIENLFQYCKTLDNELNNSKLVEYKHNKNHNNSAQFELFKNSIG
jgi:hypothetical protein